MWKFKKNKDEKKTIEREIEITLLYQNNNVTNNALINSNNNSMIGYRNFAECIRETLIEYSANNLPIDVSNIILLLIIDKKHWVYMMDILSTNTGLRFKIKNIDKYNTLTILISGSITSYKEMYGKISIASNPIAKMILEALYDTNSCYFEDFIKYNLMERELFNSMDNIEFKFNHKNIDGCLIMDLDNIKVILSKVEQYGFGITDILDLTSIIYNYNGAIYNSSIFNALMNCPFDGIRGLLGQAIPNYQKYITPRFVTIEEELKKQYEFESTEPIGEERIEYEELPKSEELLKEDEDGNMHYDEKDFE